MDNDQLLQKIDMARKAGIPEDVIRQRVQGQFGVDPATIKPTPTLQKWENNWLAGPIVKYGGGVLEAARKLYLLSNPEYRSAAFGKSGQLDNPEEAARRARVMAMDKPVFTSEHQQQYVREKPVEATAKNFAGAASYVIPAGKTFKGALALGGTMGGLRAYSEEKATPGSVAGGIAGGAVAGGAIYGAGKAISGIRNKAANAKGAIQKAATQEYLKTTPSQWAKAMEEHKIDPNVVFNKYVNPNSNYDDALAQMGAFMDDAEKTIQATSKGAGTNVRISGDDVIKVLRQQSKSIKTQLGSESQRKALDKILEEAERKYSKGISVNNALKTLRAANEKWGKAIVETESGSTVTAAQKLEATTLRDTLKKMFPEIKDSLRIEEELFTLMPIVKMAKAKANTAGLPGSIGELFKERVMPKLATKLRDGSATPIVSGGVPQTPAGFVSKTPSVPAPTGMTDWVRDASGKLVPKPSTLNMGTQIPPAEYVVRNPYSLSADVGLKSGILKNRPGSTTLFNFGQQGVKETSDSLLSQLDDALAKNNPIKAEEIGYQIKNLMGSSVEFQQPGTEALLKIATKFPKLSNSLLKGMNQEVIQEVAGGFAPGSRAIFDQALLNKDWAKVVQMIPSMPKDYVAKFADQIPSGLRPGMANFSAMGDIFKGGPQAALPSIKTLATQQAGLLGANIAGGSEPAPITSSNVKSQVQSVVESTPDDQEQKMKLAYMMWKYPTKAAMIKSAYETVFGKTATVDAVTKGKIQDAEAGLRLMNTLKSKYQEVQQAGLTASGPGVGILKGLGGSAAAALQTSPQATAYQNSIAAFMSRLARAAGEKGVLTDPDIERIRKAIPTFYTSPAVAEQQWALIEAIISGAIQTGATKGEVPDNPEDLYQ